MAVKAVSKLLSRYDQVKKEIEEIEESLKPLKSQHLDFWQELQKNVKKLIIILHLNKLINIIQNHVGMKFFRCLDSRG